MKFLSTLTISLFFVSCSSPMLHQRVEHSQTELFTPVFVETLNFPSDEAEKSRLDLNIRVQYDFFVFVRNTSNDQPFPLIGKAEITVEIIDSSNNSIARESFRKNLEADEQMNVSNSKRYLQKYFSFNLLPASYTLYYEVNDLESERKFSDKSKKITLKDFVQEKLEISNVIFADRQVRQDSIKILPLNYGGDALFGQNFDGWFELCSTYLIESIKITYKISAFLPETESSAIILIDTLHNSSFTIGKIFSIVEQDQNSFYQYDSIRHKDIYTARIQFRGDTLQQGRYLLEITASAGSIVKTLKQKFDVRWFDMPRSLHDFKLAVEALEYIMKKDEFEKLKDAGEKKQQQLFNEFWKRMDKTPETAFNEVMAEYYKRVDYAFVNFSTIRLYDGVKTDRGKAYILYGPPTKIDRDLSPSVAPKETWTYINLEKRLIFIDESRTGDYKLLSSEKLAPE
jgi:GWxTD domain-containing protein